MNLEHTLFNNEIWSLFVRPGEVEEVRILNAYGKSQAWEKFAKGVVSGYFDDHKAFCGAVKAADKTLHGGIYFTLQVIDPRLIGRAFNRLKAAEATTSDQNVIAYRWLPVDIDPKRPSGVSASDSELKEALRIRNSVAQYAISGLGFSSPIKAVSGNGGHLLFRLQDMPVSDQTKLFIQSTLTGAYSGDLGRLNRRKSAASSGASRPPKPEQSGHRSERSDAGFKYFSNF